MDFDSFGSCDAVQQHPLTTTPLCALTAHQVASGAVCLAYGKQDTGLIVVPERPGPPCETSLDRPD